MMKTTACLVCLSRPPATRVRVHSRPELGRDVDDLVARYQEGRSRGGVSHVHQRRWKRLAD